MNCSRLETLLTDYLEDTLDERVRQAVELHLRECPECSALARQVLELRRELAEFPEIRVTEEFIHRVLVKTSGVPRQNGMWRDLVVAWLRPLCTQRYAFATLVMFAFLSLTANVMGPTFSAAGSSLLNPAALVARADELTGQIYRSWEEFNGFKARVSEEVRLLREDLVGRLDYHLVTMLFASYDETVRDQQTEPGSEARPPDSQAPVQDQNQADLEKESSDEQP